MKTVVITGGTRGLGQELTKAFRKRGFNVVLSGTSADGAAKAAETLSALPGEGGILGAACDSSSLEQVQALAAAALERFGTIDIWINNAGINQSYQYLWELEDAEIDRLLAVDLKGAVNGSLTALRIMKEQGYGAIFNMEGMGSNDAFQPRFSMYGTAKRAVTYFTDALAKEIEEQGLPVMAGKLSPGIMITDFLTSAGSRRGASTLDEKTKKVYNILGDYPDVIAEHLTAKMLSSPKNGCRIEWLTRGKAARRFMTAAFNKRDFFAQSGSGPDKVI